MDKQDSWIEWKQHVLIELDRLHSRSLDIEKLLTKIELDLTTLKVKAGLWGAVSGLGSGIAVLAWEWMKKNQ